MSRVLDTWYSLPDLDRMARFGKALDGEIALGKLTRLAALLSNANGSVNARLAIRQRGDGRLELRLTCSADVEVICQRCLEPMRCELSAEGDYLLVEGERADNATTADRADFEVLELAGERLNPKELIEEELLVSLPFAPRHEDERSCGSLARKLEELSNESSDGAGAAAANH